MRIPLTELNRPKTLTLRGNEEWLERLYADFPLGRERPLTGTLTVAVGPGGDVTVKGHVAFSPTVECGRCAKSIPWPLDLEVDARFLPERGPETKRDMTLTEADLDDYYIEMGAIDLEQVLVDAVQTAMPSQLVHASEDAAECVVFEDVQHQPEKPASPFAALKDLKLKN